MKWRVDFTDFARAFNASHSAIAAADAARTSGWTFPPPAAHRRTTPIAMGIASPRECPDSMSPFATFSM